MISNVNFKQQNNIYLNGHLILLLGGMLNKEGSLTYFSFQKGGAYWIGGLIREGGLNREITVNEFLLSTCLLQRNLAMKTVRLRS